MKNGSGRGGCRARQGRLAVQQGQGALGLRPAQSCLKVRIHRTEGGRIMFYGVVLRGGECAGWETNRKTLPSSAAPRYLVPDLLVRWQPFCMLPSIAVAQT